MKRAALWVVGILSLGLCISSCDRESIRVSDTISTRTYGVQDYSGISISNTFNAYVTFSDTEERIEIEANENIQDRIIVQREGNVLRIRLKKNTNLRGDVVLNAFIVTRDLSYVKVSGASSMVLENPWTVPDSEIEVSGASDFRGELNIGNLRLQASGASDVDLYGNAEAVRAELTGSSDLKDYDLRVDALDIELSGASEAWLSVDESIAIDASGASTLRFRGNAQITRQRLSGASAIVHTD
ncbi:MAG: head GIN domain-containing protein [Bacteroidota bacterium]